MSIKVKILNDSIITHEGIFEDMQAASEWYTYQSEGGNFGEGYVVEYIDLEQDYDYLLAKCHSLRASEYPSLGDQADAAFKARQGDDSQQLAIDTLIAAVKAKYPKPELV